MYYITPESWVSPFLEGVASVLFVLAIWQCRILWAALARSVRASLTAELLCGQGQLLSAAFEPVCHKRTFRKWFWVTELLGSDSSGSHGSQFKKVTHLLSSPSTFLHLPPHNLTMNFAAWMLFPSSFSNLNSTHPSGPSSGPLQSLTRTLSFEWSLVCPWIPRALD